MSEEISILKKSSKSDNYQHLLPQIESLTNGEVNLYANLANISAALNQYFDFWWVGFYLVEDRNLVLGPFQGPVACTRIKAGNGVCGTALKEKRIIIVDDVDQFPGHIACSSLTKSEIVVPVFKDEEVVMVLDVDSDKLAFFDGTDSMYLKQLCNMISKLI